jgi:hypothetical protein
MQGLAIFADSEYDPVAQNFLTEEGFQNLVSNMLRIVEDGWLFESPPCATYGFLSSSTTCRSEALQ